MKQLPHSMHSSFTTTLTASTNLQSITRCSNVQVHKMKNPMLIGHTPGCLSRVIRQQATKADKLLAIGWTASVHTYTYDVPQQPEKYTNQQKLI